MTGRVKIGWTVCLWCTAAALGQTAPAPAPVNWTILIRQAEADVQADGAAILARPDLGAADRQKITDILQRAHAAADKALADAADTTLDPKVTRQELAPLLAHFIKPVADEFNTFITPRPDLDWMRARATAIRAVEDKMLQTRTGDYLSVVKDAGIGAADVEAISGILDKCRDDLESIQKLMRAATVLASDDAGKQRIAADYMAKVVQITAAGRAAVRARLNNAQVEMLDWQFLQEYKGIPDYDILGYSSQAYSFVAPQDGSFCLELYPDRKVLATVTLKKGAIMGFRKKDAALKAFAGDKEFDLPADVVYWRRAPAE